ncbi:MAG: hypothetical protein ACE5GG_00365 [Candidatus Omnitrophota bacterium]
MDTIKRSPITSMQVTGDPVTGDLRKGQNTAEYAIVLGLVIAVAIGMRTYVQRGLQGKSKDVVDGLATQTADSGLGDFALSSDNRYKQFEPYYLDSNFTNETNVKETVKFGGDTDSRAATSSQRDVGIGDTEKGKYTSKRFGSQTYKKGNKW